MYTVVYSPQRLSLSYIRIHGHSIRKQILHSINLLGGRGQPSYEARFFIYQGGLISSSGDHAFIPTFTVNKE